MHLRKSLVAVAVAVAVAVVAAGLIGLSSGAYASTGTVTGNFKSGNATFAGSTYGCVTSSVAGTYDTVNNPALVFNAANINCSSPVGTIKITLNGCGVPVTLGSRTSGVDTNITGVAALGSGLCVQISALGNLCAANVNGNLNVTYDETLKPVSGINYQDLTLSGSGTLANQVGCFGLLGGSFTLNNIVFSLTPAINFV